MSGTRWPVTFDHAVYFAGLAERGSPEEICALYHHPVDDKESFAACGSDAYHDYFNPKDKSVQSFSLATHKKNKDSFYSCVSCHEEIVGDDLPRQKRLVGCKASACHP